MKILVTGAGGFTGSYLVEELAAAGMEVVGLSRRPIHSINSQIRYVRTELFDLERLSIVVNQIQPRAVIHLAAESFVGQQDVETIYRSNLFATRNLLVSLAQLKQLPEIVLLASSANVYGNAELKMIDEQARLAPENDYAVSKVAMEYLAKTWMNQLPIVLVRPFNYSGVGQQPHFLLPKLVNHFAMRAPRLELGNLDVIRDFSDVRMVVKVYRQLLQNKFSGETVNICSGQGHSLEQILTLLTELSEYRPEICINPAYIRKNEVKCLIGSKVHLERLIGRLDPYPLKETLTWMLNNA